MSLTLNGTFLSVERKSGTFNGNPYDFSQAHILDGDTVRKIRLPKGAHVVPFERFHEVSVPVNLSDDGTRMSFSQEDYELMVKGELRPVAKAG